MNALPYLFAIAMFGSLGQALSSEGFSFPGTRARNSPKKMWIISCEEDRRHEGAYTLTLHNRKTGAQQEIFRGGRWCEVLWSRDESCLAITDWAGSNCSEIVWLNTKEKGPAKPLPDAGVASFITEIELVGHCYWEALNWQTDRRLRFRVFGHTDERPLHQFAYEFLWDRTKKRVTLVKKDNALNSKAEQRILENRQKRWKRGTRGSSRSNKWAREHPAEPVRALSGHPRGPAAGEQIENLTNALREAQAWRMRFLDPDHLDAAQPRKGFPITISGNLPFIQIYLCAYPPVSV